MSEYTDDALARKTLEFWERVVLTPKPPLHNVERG
jgi:hypothetical protein